MRNEIKDICAALQDGELVVMPTDTIWGILADARNVNAVEKLYTVRGRDEKKPCIVLVEHAAQIFDVFDIWEALSVRDVLTVLWSETLTPRGKHEALLGVLSEPMLAQLDLHRAVSVVLPAASDALKYIHRGTQTIAFRKPSRQTPWGAALSDVIKKTGPLIAPSANPPGKPPAHTTKEAQQYFGSAVACYAQHIIHAVGASEPSHVIQWDGTAWTVLR